MIDRLLTVSLVVEALEIWTPVKYVPPRNKYFSKIFGPTPKEWFLLPHVEVYHHTKLESHLCNLC